MVLQRSGIAAIAACLLLLCIGCSHKDVKLRTSAVEDRGSIPVLITDSISTLISDSGITRYRISAPRWEVYDKAVPAHWNFPQGLFLEVFDESLEVQQTIRSRYAYYNQDAHTWLLRDSVHAVNENGELFDTPELNWDQDSEWIYSDSSIVITKQQTIIQGVGFTSNQAMTKYTILNPTGIIPVEEDNDANE